MWPGNEVWNVFFLPFDILASTFQSVSDKLMPHHVVGLEMPWIRLGMAANAVQTDRSAERPWHRTQITSYRDFQNEWLCHCVLIDVHQAVWPLASQQVSLKAKIEREDFSPNIQIRKIREASD